MEKNELKFWGPTRSKADFVGERERIRREKTDPFLALIGRNKENKKSRNQETKGIKVPLKTRKIK